MSGLDDLNFDDVELDSSNPAWSDPAFRRRMQESPNRPMTGGIPTDIATDPDLGFGGQTVAQLLGNPAPMRAAPEIDFDDVPEEGSGLGVMDFLRNPVATAIGEIGHQLGRRNASDNIERTYTEALVTDPATRLREGTRNVVSGLLGAPVEALNLAQVLQSPAALAARVAGGRPAIQQPEFVRGMQEALDVENQQDIAANLSKKAQAQRGEVMGQQGIVDTVGYLATHPQAAASEMIAQVPQFLQIVRGSRWGTIALQSLAAGAQNGAQVYQELVAKGADPAEADRVAQAASNLIAVGSGVLTQLPGASGFERVLAGRAGREGAERIAPQVVRELVGEPVSEAGQEAYEQAVQNVATGRPIGEGVGQAAGLGATIGVPGGVIAAGADVLADRAAPAATAEPEPATAAAPQPNVLSAAIADALQTAQEAPQGAPAPAAPTPALETAAPTPAPGAADAVASALAAAGPGRVDAGVPPGVPSAGRQPAGEAGESNAEVPVQGQVREALRAEAAPEGAGQARRERGEEAREPARQVESAPADSLAPRIPPVAPIPETLTLEQARAEYDQARTDDERSAAAARIAAAQARDRESVRGEQDQGEGDRAAVRPGATPDASGERPASDGAQVQPGGVRASAAAAAEPGAEARSEPDGGRNAGVAGEPAPALRNAGTVTDRYTDTDDADIRAALGPAARGVTVSKSPRDLHPEDRQRLGITDADLDDVEGVYDPDTGRSHVFTDNLAHTKRELGLTDAQAKVWVAGHERSGHAGIRGMVSAQAGGNRAGVLAMHETLNRARNNPTIAALADAIGSDRPERGNRLVEEALAELAAAHVSGDYGTLERKYGVEIPAAQRKTLDGYLRRLVDSIKRAFGKAGEGMSDAAVYRLIRDANRYAKRGEVRGTSAVAARAPRSAGPRDEPAAGRALRERWTRDFDGVWQEYAGLKGAFDTDGGRILSVDSARELSPEYRADRSRSADIHEAASDFIKEAYRRRLAEPTPAGKTPDVVLSAGGTGAGKTSGLMHAGPTVDAAELIYDTNVANAPSGAEKIEAALASGRNVNVVYTYRDPVEALRNGALPRAEGMARNYGSGRTVPVTEHAKTHVGSSRAIRELMTRYADDPRVSFTLIDNSRGRGNAAVVHLESLPEVHHNGLDEALARTVEAEYQAGRISERTRNGFLHGTRPEDGRGDRGEPAPQDQSQVAARARLDAERGSEPTTEPEQNVPFSRRRTVDPYGADKGSDLEGMPNRLRVGDSVYEFHGYAPAQEIAAKYAARNGATPPRTYAAVDEARAKRIAAAYDAMEHAPGDPEVKRAYDAMIDETLQQYRDLLKTGIEIEFIDGADPYADSPRRAILDVVENNHLWVFPTDNGFGSSAFDVSENPLLRPTEFQISGRLAVANDIFRVVHDYFGHIANGVGFRADGEENAWREHSVMYSPLARRAMTSETRGQNSWVNYGPYGEKNRTASAADTTYADQKTGLMPEWVSEEGRGDAPVASRPARRVQEKFPEFRRWSHGNRVYGIGEIHDDYAGGPAVFEMLHGTTADFDAFDRSKSTPVGYFGAGFYFSDTPEDVSNNYAGVGPDLQMKIEITAERIAQESGREYDDPEVLREARDRFVRHDGATVPAYVRVDNPAVFAGEGDPSRTILTLKENEETGSYEGSVEELVNAMRFVANDFVDANPEDAIEGIINRALDNDGEIALETVNRLIRQSGSLGYATDENGDMAIGEYVRRVLAEIGYDGIVDKMVFDRFGPNPLMMALGINGGGMQGLTEDTTHVIAFEPTQVKSSIGNRGTFDPENPSLVASRTPAQARAERQQLLGHLAANGFPGGPAIPPPPRGNLTPIREKIDYARTKLQDRMLVIRRLQERAGGKNAPGQTSITLADNLNTYWLETLMHGAARDIIEGGEHKFLTPLQGRLKNFKMSAETFEGWLLARATAEINAQVAAVNPAMPDGGSGMTTAAAAAVLNGTGPNPYTGKPMTAEELRQAAQLAPLVDGLRDATLDNMVAGGQITQQLADELRKRYPNYIPVRGSKKVEDWMQTFTGGTGKGLSGKKAPIKRRLGRGEDNLPVDILGEMAGDFQRSAIARAKAKVNQAFLRFALANPMPELYNVEPVDLEWKYSKATGEAYLGVKASSDDLQRSIVVMHDGNPVRIRFEDPAIRDAMLNMGPEDMAGIVKVLGAVNRWRSKVLTQYNPAFTPVNVARDAIFGMSALAAEHGPAVAADAALHYVQAAAAMYRQNTSRPGDYANKSVSQYTMDDFAREASANGMKTGLTRVDDVKDLQRKMTVGVTTLMQLAAEGRPWTLARESVTRALDPITSVISNVNDATENALRLSTYAALRKRGMSADKAAEYAKNLTINFNRRGQWGPVLNSLYLFYNASMQGTHAVQRVLRNPKVVAALVGLGTLQAVLLRQMMDDDDGDGVTPLDGVPDYVRRTAFIIPLGFLTGDKNDYFAIPMPYGYNIFPYVGGRVSQWQKMGARETDTSVFADVGKSMVESFSPVPINGDYGSLYGDQLGFAMQLMSNRDDEGRPIANVNAYADYDIPRALQGRASTPQVYEWAAQQLAKLGGGDLSQRIPPVGYLDVAPEQVETVANYLGGGLTQLVNKGMRWAETFNADTFEGGMDMVAKTPIASRFFGKASDNRAIADRYYGEKGELARKTDVLQDKLQGLPDADVPRAIRETGAADVSMRGLSAARYKKGERKGQIKRTGSKDASRGRVVLDRAEGSTPAAMKAADKAVSDLGLQINRVRDDEITVQQVVDIGKDNDLTLEQIGLPAQYNGEAVAPARIRQRTIKLLQDKRTQKEKDALRMMQFNRTNALTPEDYVGKYWDGT